MVRRFWLAFAGLVIGLLVVNLLSWLYIVSHLAVQVPALRSASQLVLPTEAPSIWNLIQPQDTKSWLGPILVLILQVWLTGGFYGTLIRANTNEAANVPTFLVDGFRSFGRLLMWNLLWAAVSIAVIGVAEIIPGIRVLLSLLLILLRFVFLFVDVALVAERDIRYAFKLAPRLLLTQWLTMLPFAVSLVVLTDVGRWMTSVFSGFGMFLVSIVYTTLTAWILHMVVARYVVFSDWRERRDFTQASAET